MQKLLYILFCITLISCNSKKEELKDEEIVVFSDNGTTIYESDIYEVINAFFEDEKEINILEGIDYNGELLTVYPNSNYVHPEELGELGFTTEEDRNFIFQQISSLREYDVQQSCFSDFKLIPRIEIEDMWTSIEKEFMNSLQNGITFDRKEYSNKFKNRYGKTEFYYLTIPLFSKDKNLSIIIFGNQHLPSGGYGGLYVYKKENNKWILMKKGSSWLAS